MGGRDLALRKDLSEQYAYLMKFDKDTDLNPPQTNGHNSHDQTSDEELKTDPISDTENDIDDKDEIENLK